MVFVLKICMLIAVVLASSATCQKLYADSDAILTSIDDFDEKEEAENVPKENLDNFSQNVNTEEVSPRDKRDLFQPEKNVQDTVKTSLWETDSSHIEQESNVASEQNASKESNEEQVADGKASSEKAGRGIRGTNDEQWIKLTYPSHAEEAKNPPSFSSQDLLNSRMPRVNFVTQTKRIDASESRYQRESVTKPESERSKGDSLRTDFTYPDNRARNDDSDSNRGDSSSDNDDYPIYPDDRVKKYYETQARLPMYEPRSYDPTRRLDPYIIPYDEPLRRHPDDYYARRGRNERINYSVPARKSRRIIYYATLPEVIRAPPRVDLRNRYNNYDRMAKYDRNYAGVRPGGYYEIYSARNRYPYADMYEVDDRYNRGLFTPKTEPNLIERNVDRKSSTEKPKREDSSKDESDIPPLRYEERPLRSYDDYRMRSKYENSPPYLRP